VSVLERYETVPQPSRLSGPALEVLSIIAYRQPIGRLEVEDIRGVSSSGVLKTLQDRSLIDVVGRAEGLGRPLLYGTTSKFLEHFGFRSLEDLPRPDELPVVLQTRPLERAAGGAAAGAGDQVEPIPPGEPGHVAAPEPVSEAELDREAELIVAAGGAADEAEAELAQNELLQAASLADTQVPAILLEEFESPAQLDAELLEQNLEIEQLNGETLGQTLAIEQATEEPPLG
jgi:hypothetical protein